MSRRLTVVLVLLAAAAAAALGTIGVSGGAVSHGLPRCFGAASRDIVHPCHNSGLADLVIPTPRRALQLPNAHCGFLRVSVPFVCTFGVPARLAKRTVALVGDSHATHWRAALAPVALGKSWHGLSLTRAACPYSFAPPVLPRRLLGDCLRWRALIPRWFRRHPEVSEVFVSAHPVHVAGRSRSAETASAVAGFERAWHALPHTVKRIVVLRDTPIDPLRTPACVYRALARHRDAGSACAVPRGLALRRDAATIAARRWHSHRVSVIDMTHYMCDRTRCFPVVGGALVHKDASHITAIFGATLAPYLRRAVDRLG